MQLTTAHFVKHVFFLISFMYSKGTVFDFKAALLALLFVWPTASCYKLRACNLLYIVWRAGPVGWIFVFLEETSKAANCQIICRLMYVYHMQRILRLTTDFVIPHCHTRTHPINLPGDRSTYVHTINLPGMHLGPTVPLVFFTKSSITFRASLPFRALKASTLFLLYNTEIKIHNRLNESSPPSGPTRSFLKKLAR